VPYLKMNPRSVRKVTREALKTRALIFAGIIVYLIQFEWMYRELISPAWAYLGLRYETPSSLATAIGWAGSLLPVLWMPLTLRRPSQAIYWLLYLTVYIPSMLVPYYLNLQPVSELAEISLYFLGGFALINMSFRIPLPVQIRMELRQKDFWVMFWLLYVTMTLVFMAALGSTLRLVSFAERYDLRLASRQVESGALVEYFRNWLAFCLNPFLLAMGCLRKRPTLFLAGVAGGILLYSSAAARAWLAGIFYIPVLYFALQGKRKGTYFGLRMVLFTCAMFLLPIVLHVAESPFEGIILDPFVIRNHVNSGAMTGLYAKFFSENPLTYGSQITGIDLLLKYPYSMPIPFLMGVYIADAPDSSANAHLWADGIASFGPVGVLILSILLAGVFFVLDFCCQHLDPVKVALVVGIHYANLSNVALSSSFFGGGLAFSIVLLMLMPRSLLEPAGQRKRRFPLYKLNRLPTASPSEMGIPSVGS